MNVNFSDTSPDDFANNRALRPEQRAEPGRAGQFHAGWTPRGWSDAKSKLVGFEQLLYLRQPGYGPSYVVGKAQLDKMIARASHQAEATGKPFSLKETFAAIWAGSASGNGCWRCWISRGKFRRDKALGGAVRRSYGVVEASAP